MVSTTAAGDVRLRGILTVLLCGIAMGGAIDLWMDRPNNPGLFHVAFETAVSSLALGGVAYLWAGWMRTRRSLTRTLEVSDRLREERGSARHASRGADRLEHVREFSGVHGDGAAEQEVASGWREPLALPKRR